MDITLSAQIREQKEKLSVDFVPAVLYGRGVASVSLKLKRGEIDRVIHQAGESNLINLSYDNNHSQVLIKEAQRSGMSGKLLHVDFFQVNMTDKITTEIPLHFIGESKVVKEMSGSLIKDTNVLEVECLPSDLVDHIDIDISVLKEYHDEISVRDVILPKGMTLVHDTDRIIASVIPPRVQEVVAENKTTTTEVKEENKA